MTTEVITLFGKGARFNALFSRSISSACGTGICVQHAGLELADPDPDELPEEIMSLCKPMQRPSAQELLRNLTLERNTVCTVLRHGFYPPEACPGGSNQYAHSVHQQRRTRGFENFCTLSHEKSFRIRPSDLQRG